MPVDPVLTAGLVAGELARIEGFARDQGWIIVFPNDDNRLHFRVTMKAKDNSFFILDVECTGFAEQPPALEFVDKDGNAGNKKDWPSSDDSFFNPNGPQICAPCNRLAYKSVRASGLHGEWQLGNWTKIRAANFNWQNLSRLGDILIHVQMRLMSRYNGRMA